MFVRGSVAGGAIVVVIVVVIDIVVSVAVGGGVALEHNRGVGVNASTVVLVEALHVKDRRWR